MSDTLKILDRALADNADEDLTADSYITNSRPSTVNALSNVINFILTDAFDLSAEESILVSHNLGIVLHPLKDIIPTATMGAVRQEIMTGEYSKRLLRRYDYPTNGSSNVASSNVKYATIDAWVESLSETIFASYPNLRPMISSSIIGGLHGLLTELGITSNPRKSRASLYLPNSIRHLLNNRR